MKSDPCLSRTKSGTCRCTPKCAICGWGKHMAVHMPAFKDGAKVRDYFDHEFVPRTVKVAGKEG